MSSVARPIYRDIVIVHGYVCTRSENVLFCQCRTAFRAAITMGRVAQIEDTHAMARLHEAVAISRILESDVGQNVS